MAGFRQALADELTNDQERRGYAGMDNDSHVENDLNRKRIPFVGSISVSQIVKIALDAGVDISALSALDNLVTLGVQSIKADAPSLVRVTDPLGISSAVQVAATVLVSKADQLGLPLLGADDIRDNRPWSRPDDPPKITPDGAGGWSNVKTAELRPDLASAAYEDQVAQKSAQDAAALQAAVVVP